MIVNTNMFQVEIDANAKNDVMTKYGLPPCLHIPIAARNEEAISRFIGKITRILRHGSPNQALLVNTYEIPDLDLRLPICRL
ncbi:MAG: hypothetical protein WCO97_07355, partial [bacterium]